MTGTQLHRDGERGLEHFLRTLARPQARVDLVPAEEAAVPEVSVSSTPAKNGHQHAARRFPRALFDHASSQGLVMPVDGSHRLSPAGAAWLRRRLSEGDGFREQHQVRGRRTVILDSGARQTVETNDTESPLQWLNRRRDKDGQPMLSSEQFDAGERLRADYTFSQLTPRVTSSWSPVGSSGGNGSPGHPADLRDNVIAARERVHRALTAVGPELAGILIDVCCHLQGLAETEKTRGWPQRSGKLILLLALSSLARHYGLLASKKAAPAAKAAVRHWGSGDYRPGFEARLSRTSD